MTSAKGNRIAIVGAGPGGVSAALALLQKVESLSLTGEPRLRLNNSLTGFESLPLKLDLLDAA